MILIPTYQLPKIESSQLKYLARIGATETDACSCGYKSKSVDHFLFRCALWLDQRRNICRLASKSSWWGDLSFALGDQSREMKVVLGLSESPVLRWQSSLLQKPKGQLKSRMERKMWTVQMIRQRAAIMRRMTQQSNRICSCTPSLDYPNRHLPTSCIL